MTRKFNALHIGTNNFNHLFENSEDVKWNFLHQNTLEVDDNYKIIQNLQEENKTYDLIFIQTPYSTKLELLLEHIITPFNTFVDYLFWNTGYIDSRLMINNRVEQIQYTSSEELYDLLKTISFPGQYGDKLSPATAIVNSSFKGDYYYNGNNDIILNGNFGDELNPIISWKKNLIYDKGKVVEIFPHFNIDGEIEIEYTFKLLKYGTADTILSKHVINHGSLSEPIYLPIRDEGAVIVSSLKAKGSGTLRVGALHKRLSRKHFGEFILGGKKFVDNKRDEFIYYLNPGDLKPPLNVYFSGYRSAEGFEGYYMMSRLNAPFLLIGDPRLEGGGFYLGSDQYEQGIKDIISLALEELGFTNDELILSGLSMGSFGALYYGVQMQPSAIIVGKPLVNIGSIAKNMRLIRPEDFGTAIDVLLKNEGGIDTDAINSLNEKFWKVMQNGYYQNTTFAISYMENDDHDPSAFDDLLPFLTKKKAQVISRGIPGRHNDDSNTITSWFVNFYSVILESKFGRQQNE